MFLCAPCQLPLVSSGELDPDAMRLRCNQVIEG